MAGTVAAGVTRSGNRLETARALVALTKPRIIELLLVTTVPTMVLAQRGLPSAGLIAATLAGGTLSAGGANALNMVYDRDIDAKMGRTRNRPLVTGALSAGSATVFALALEAAAFAVLWTCADLLAAGLALGAAAFYVGVYTAWLKRSTPQNIVIGGAAGAAPVLVAWAAVTGGLSPVAWGLFAVILLWTPPHFWALAIRFKDDYSEAAVPMLPAVADLGKVADRILGYTMALVAVSVAVAAGGTLGPLYVAGAVAGGALFLAKAWLLRRHPSPRQAMSLFHFSISYLTVLFLCVGLSVLVPW